MKDNEELPTDLIIETLSFVYSFYLEPLPVICALMHSIMFMIN